MTLVGEIRSREAALERLSWRAPLPLAEAQPVSLPTLQSALGHDQQAVLFYFAGDELIAFVIGRASVQVVRHLCRASDLEEAIAEWQFQLGRAETSADYRARHTERFRRALYMAVARLYGFILAPLVAELRADRLLFIPHGMLHQVPLHALWMGNQFVTQAFECSYAPSATLAVALWRPGEQLSAWQTWRPGGNRGRGAPFFVPLALPGRSG
jgi:hypothetical protein